jgi:hypothetical protein
MTIARARVVIIGAAQCGLIATADLAAAGRLTTTAGRRSSRAAVARDAYELVLETGFVPVDGVVHVDNRGTDQVDADFLLGQSRI